MIIRTCKFLVYFKKNIDGDFTSTFRMTFYKLTNLIKGLQEFKSFIEFHGIYNTHRSYVKFSFLNIGSFQWLQAFEVIIVMLHWIIEELPIWTFRWLQPSLIWFVLPRFQFSLLTFIEFSIYSRLFSKYLLEIFSTRGDTFHIIAILFNLVYRVEISTRVKNLHIIGPLVNANKNVTELLLILILAEKDF